MADPKSIHEFLPTSGNIGSLFLVDDPDSQATSGYITRNISMDDVGEMVNNGIDYTQDLDTENKKVLGAINELHGVDGYDVYDETRTSSNKYVQGDICIHSDTLQVCTDANGAYGAWDSTKWSPTTIKALLALKQDSTDNSLNTTNKQIVPAINELNSNKANSSDVITWKTTITSSMSRLFYFVIVSNLTTYQVWFTGSGSSSEVNITNLFTNKRYNSTPALEPTITDADTNIVFKRNSNGTLTINFPSQNCCAIIG